MTALARWRDEVVLPTVNAAAPAVYLCNSLAYVRTNKEVNQQLHADILSEFVGEDELMFSCFTIINMSVPEDSGCVPTNVLIMEIA